ncbi:hypothetical protein COE08_00860 [Priestia megaterium]|uniref:ATP-binding protein n=1 Tax=Priestia megaterium TaxID=1404 RepID=UPI000BFDAF35|nr:ATP-binding protein [Priestia megaterium]PGX23260.1 hypothetical protein COE08_00860 [Priestia megaterium]
MKTIHLLSLLNAKKNLTPTAFNTYLNHHNIEIKESEVKDLRALVTELLKSIRKIEMLQGFYVGYKINQISKEFDLLRFGKNTIINVELKRENTGERIKNQLIRNRYYLSFLDKEVLNFTYVAEGNKLYYLDKSELLTEVEFTFLISALLEQDLVEIEDIHKLFDPSNYLVSPFNSTEKFLENKYFLTENQENIKKDILKLSTKTSPCFITLQGHAGTGKTLLTYDIAKEAKKNSKNVLLFFCGALNRGHIELRDNHYWDISSIKYYNVYDFKNYDLIIVDETQRIEKTQIEKFLIKAKETDTKYIFSYDPQQCLSTWEIKNNIPQYIKEQVSANHFRLTGKIRTNKEIASFVKNLFDLSKKSPEQKYSNIHIEYFSTPLAVKKELDFLKGQGWKIINYTPSRFQHYPYDEYQDGHSESAHNVIGQEFDKVVAVLDQHFFYNKERQLSTQGWDTAPYYHPTKMLFQIVTRARKKLHIIIINNEAILNQCLKILEPNKK